MKDLKFPSNKLYFQWIKNQDLIFFIGQEQPTDGGTRYAEGQKAYRMAQLRKDDPDINKYIGMLESGLSLSGEEQMELTKKLTEFLEKD